jgi:Yip1 domain
MDLNETTNSSEQEVGELSHSDKMIGVFTEPTRMFSITSKFAPRHKDWVIPVVIFFIVIALIRILAMTNKEVYFEAKKQGIDRIEKMVESGTMTREQGDEAIDAIDQQMEFMQGPIGWVISIVSTLIFGFIFFLILIGIYYLFIKFLLKGEGTFTSALVASGLTTYISILQIILGGILTMLLGKMIMDTSLASLMGSDKTTLTGWLLAKVDPISIWAYVILAIGFAKMFKSESTGKYYAVVFGLWLIGGFILFQLAQAFPFLQAFIQ